MKNQKKIGKTKISITLSDQEIEKINEYHKINHNINNIQDDIREIISKYLDLIQSPRQPSLLDIPSAQAVQAPRQPSLLDIPGDQTTQEPWNEELLQW